MNEANNALDTSGRRRFVRIDDNPAVEWDLVSQDIPRSGMVVDSLSTHGAKLSVSMHLILIVEWPIRASR